MSSILSIDENLKGTINLDQSGPKNNLDEGVLHVL